MSCPSPDDPLIQRTARQARDAIAAGDCSAEQLTRAYLDRIEHLNPTIRCYHEVYDARAIDRARAVDRGEVTGPLAGVPIALKDNLCTRFGRTTASSRMLAEYRAPYDATVVQRLEAAGAVILGKTVLDEFAMGSSTEHAACGVVRNPWDVRRVPGGSSGGSAAAVAARLCAAAIGSDTGGSIRQPAALCGVVGFKPTYGVVSRWGLLAFASSLDQIGPLTRDLADPALLTDVISGHDPLDSTAAPRPATRCGDQPAPPSPLRIGVAREYLSDRNDPAVTDATDRAIARLAEAGAEIVDLTLPHTRYGIPTYYIVAPAEASSNLARYDGVHFGHRTAQPRDLADLYADSRGEGFGPEVKRRLMLGAYVLSSGYYDAYYHRALRVRRLIRQDFDAAFQRCDAILCPTTASPAFEIGAKADDPLAMYLNDIYTVNANLAGIPGVSLPAGFARPDKAPPLPVGLQLLGPAFEDARLLRIAAQVEELIDVEPILPPVS